QGGATDAAERDLGQFRQPQTQQIADQAWIALLIALCVPVCNVAAVWPLARHAGHNFLRELARNPLIVGTVTGLVGN
ncbi:hypothetical protein PTA92_24330, partial [Shigella sonnei]|nr:hypothetical protein [Shigella sonnei]